MMEEEKLKSIFIPSVSRYIKLTIDLFSVRNETFFLPVMKEDGEIKCVDKIFQVIFFFYLQISTLIQHRSERPHFTSATSERTLRAIGRVGQAVNLVRFFFSLEQKKIISICFHWRVFISQAVERFVTVGETIADDNQDIKQDMYDACKEARVAGEAKKFISTILNREIFEQIEKCNFHQTNLGKTVTLVFTHLNALHNSTPS